MSKVLVTHRSLGYPEGSETATYTLVSKLKNHADVTVWTPAGGITAKKIGELGIPIMSFGRPKTLSIPAYKPDIIHLQHRTCAKTIIDIYPDVPKVWICHGLPDEESPAGFEKHIKHYIAVSDEVAVRLMNLGISWRDITVIWNGVDTERFKPKTSVSDEVAVQPSRAKILVLSNRFKFETFNSKYDVIGLRGNLGWKWDIENYIDKYDIIITAGRGCLEAMSMERGVIVLGPDGCDGWITPVNWRLLIGRNFSGRAFRRQFDNNIVISIIESYAKNFDEGLCAFGGKLTVEEFDIEDKVCQYLAVYKRVIR